MPIPPHRQQPFTADDALAGMDRAGIARALVQPPVWDPAANLVAQEASRVHPERFAFLATPPLDRQESPSLVEAWRGRPGFLGLRFAFVRPEQKLWLADGTMDWIWPMAEREAIPVAVSTSALLPVVGEIARRYEGLRLIVDHMGVVRGQRGDAAFESLPELLKLAALPNVAVKATGGPGYVDEPYPFPTLHKHYRRIFDAFGPERMFWGTDITRMPCSWRDCITLFTEELPWLSGRDLDLVMGRALCDWLDWRPAAARDSASSTDG